MLNSTYFLSVMPWCSGGNDTRYGVWHVHTQNCFGVELIQNHELFPRIRRIYFSCFTINTTRCDDSLKISCRFTVINNHLHLFVYFYQILRQVSVYKYFSTPRLGSYLFIYFLITFFFILKIQRSKYFTECENIKNNYPQLAELSRNKICSRFSVTGKVYFMEMISRIFPIICLILFHFVG